MKRLLISILLILSMMLPITSYAQSAPPTIYLNNVEMSFPNDPVIHRGTTMVPFRNLLEALGVNVRYHAATRSITSTKDDIVVQVFIDQTIAYRNGEAIEIAIAPYVTNGVTFVPLRFLSQSFDYHVSFSNNTIYIDSPIINTPTPAPAPEPNENLSVEEVGKLSNRVAHLEVRDSLGNVIATGSGVATGKNGEILTNYHVVENASSVKVYINENSYVSDTLLLWDEVRDLALIKIEETNLLTVKIGDSTDVSLGESVVAIGSPLGFSNTLSTGNISNTLRYVEGQYYIQTTAPIDSGSSGGALFNLKGELIGITTAKIESSANINLAIPTSDVETFLNQPRNPQPMNNPSYVKMDEKSAEFISEHLNQNHKYLQYGDSEIELEWFTFLSTDRKNFIVGAVISDFTAWLNLALYIVEDPHTMEEIYRIMFGIIEEELGVKNVSLIFHLETQLNFRPSSNIIPYEDVTYSYGYYYIDHIFSMALRDGNEFIYSTELDYVEYRYGSM